MMTSIKPSFPSWPVHWPIKSAKHLSLPEGYAIHSPLLLSAHYFGQPLVGVTANALIRATHDVLPTNRPYLAVPKTIALAKACKELTLCLLPQLAPRFTCHGTFIKIFDKGVLITGRPGIGKSHLAYAALQRGHQLIADDCPFFTKTEENMLGWCPSRIKNYLHLREFGLLSVTQHFDATAICDFAALDLEIELCDKGQHFSPLPFLSGRASAKNCFYHFVKKCYFPVESFSDLIILVEEVVKKIQQIKSTGCSMLIMPAALGER